MTARADRASAGRLVPVALAASALVTVEAGSAQAPVPGPEVGTPVELARWVDREGDAAVLDALTSADRQTRMLALRAAPWMHGPEAALGALAGLARGRDPVLAPEAARAAMRIALALDRDGLARREAVLADLQAAAATLDALADDDTARPDLRAAARAAATALRQQAGAD